MSVLLNFCFIQVVSGYVNVAQITQIILYREDAYSCTAPSSPLVEACQRTGDKTPEDFLARIERTCGGKHGGGK